jgi:C4-dicarboxylate-specific signal transduction histidine kinase
VSTSIDDGRAILVVRDHDDGLGDEAALHAFDHFWKADHARFGHGVGLGRSIVTATATADEHGGICTAENAPDGGARFALWPPIGQ